MTTKINIKLIVGLGNPGAEYAKTRHNVGTLVIEELVYACKTSLVNDLKMYGFSARGNLYDHDIRFLIPTTFMNLSGKAVAAMASFYKIEPHEILVVHDELDLPPGVARFKFGGGHGGHNGLKDIIAKLGNNKDFYRLRIGIGHPGSRDLVTGYVLTKAPNAQQKLIDESVSEAVRATCTLMKEDIDKAMHQLHSFIAK